jgi:hypothetical protein
MSTGWSASPTVGASLQGGAATLHMNHELTQATTSEPEVGRPANRGALVSKYSLDQNGAVSGERAYDTVFEENTSVGPAPTTANATPGFSRFCSRKFAGRHAGFDRGIYFTGEETEGASTFDGKGGQTVAMFDNEAHALPKLGHFAKENSIPQTRRNAKTVIMTLEDGPSGPDCTCTSGPSSRAARPCRGTASTTASCTRSCRTTRRRTARRRSRAAA